VRVIGFVVGFGVRRNRIAQFVELFMHLRENLFDVLPIETNAGHLGRDLMCFH
jgi:hypothetical protein